jgi:CheY-like chemotaxis protein
LKTVLITDDEEKLRSLLKRSISLEGFDVLEAATCKEASKKMNIYEVDVVLCDVKLPDGNGVDLVKEIRLTHPLTEIILLTAKKAAYLQKQVGSKYSFSAIIGNSPAIQQPIVLAKKVASLASFFNPKIHQPDNAGEPAGY